MVSRRLNLLMAAALVVARLTGPAMVTSAPVPPGAGPVTVPLRQTAANLTARI
jgi:hypothetical protein